VTTNPLPNADRGGSSVRGAFTVNAKLPLYMCRQQHVVAMDEEAMA
jgi:hypothetical protein